MDKLVFESFGGSDADGNEGDAGTQFVMDNFAINQMAVPEPGALLIWSVFAGTGLVVSTRRRRLA